MKKKAHDTREELLAEIDTLKQALTKAEKHNKALNASNQQLQAAEQQIKAAVQQLTATEQQLRAANQQLVASRQSLRKEKEFSENLLETANSFIVVLDVNGSISLFNKYAENLTNYQKEEVLGKNWFELFIPASVRDELPEVFLNVLREMPEFSSHDNAIKCKDGTERWISWENTLLKKDDGKISGILSIGVDITERKKSEQQIQSANQQLQAAEQQLRAANQQLRVANQQLKAGNKELSSSIERYKALITVSNTGAWEYHLDTDFLWCSPEYFSMLGRDVNDYDLSGVANLKETWIDLLHPDDRDRASNHFSNYLKKGSPGMYENYFRLQHSDGHWVWILSRGSTIRDENGKTTNLTVGTHIDITEREKAEEKLKIALEKAQESDRLKSAFLANMSHEIRTPMNGIIGFTNLLNTPEIDKEERQQYIAIINKSGDRLLNTINDLIDISKIEAGQMKISKAKTSVNNLLLEVNSFFKPEVTSKGLSIISLPTLSEKKATIITDQDKLHGILTNLIKNAIKFTKKGSITFGYFLKGNFLEFFVKDSGIGIPENRRQAVFNRFEQADIGNGYTRSFEGSGLGLAISQDYVKMLGGRIWLTSEEGKGTTFRFTIPYDAELVKPPEMPLKARQPSRKEVATKTLDLLIAEDEETSFLYLKTILNDRFRKIYYAKTGKETIKICKENPKINIILMDIKMPDINGLEATREIRIFNKDIVIIAQTAFALSGDKEKAIAAGCNDYIPKPIDKDKLIRLINQYI